MALNIYAVVAPIRALWPEGLVLAVSVAYLWGMFYSPTRSTIRLRLLSLAGLSVTVALIFLGGIWPSAYTVVAIPAIAAPFAFAVVLFRPTIISERPKLRLYLNLSVVTSALAWAFQIWWELRR